MTIQTMQTTAFFLSEISRQAQALDLDLSTAPFTALAERFAQQLALEVGAEKAPYLATRFAPQVVEQAFEQAIERSHYAHDMDALGDSSYDAALKKIEPALRYQWGTSGVEQIMEQLTSERGATLLGDHPRMVVDCNLTGRHQEWNQTLSMVLTYETRKAFCEQTAFHLDKSMQGLLEQRQGEPSKAVELILDLAADRAQSARTDKQR